MIYHRFRFGFKKNINVLLCRVVGHRLNDEPKFHSCGRCGLAYEECYHPRDYFVESGLIKVSKAEKALYSAELQRKQEKFKTEKKQSLFPSFKLIFISEHYFENLKYRWRILRRKHTQPSFNQTQNIQV